MRGDYADLLLLDEWQLMDEDAWALVGAPMLLDNDGWAVFAFTPPTLHSRSASKARDPQHAIKMYRQAASDTTGRWAAYHWRSHDNPHISEGALADIARDMTALAYRQEIEAEDIDEVPGALWSAKIIDRYRRDVCPDDRAAIVVGVDPSGGGNEQGIVVAVRAVCDCVHPAESHVYVVADASGHYTPDGWAFAAISAYREWDADRIVAERNYGGDMVLSTLRTVDRRVNVQLVQATRGKLVRAQPVAAMYEQGKVHHVGRLDQLEEQMCSYTGDGGSPDRMDALVWAITELMLKRRVSPSPPRPVNIIRRTYR